MMSRPSSLQYQYNHPSKLLNKGYNRTPLSHKGPPCPYSKSLPLLEFCITHTYFLFQGKYYEQVQGAAMGSPISPLIANIFMEEFEVKALQSFSHPLPFGLGLWMTPLSSIRQNTARIYYNTLTTRTHTSSLQ